MSDLQIYQIRTTKTNPERTDLVPQSDESDNHRAVKSSWEQVATSAIAPVINEIAQLESTAQVTGLDTALAGKLAVTNGIASNLTLSADPTVSLGAATKQYVDNNIQLVDLQTAYNNSLDPQTIKLSENEGLIIADHLNNPGVIFTETETNVLNPFIVSTTGSEGLAVLSTTDSISTMLEVKSANRLAKPFPDMDTVVANAIDKTDAPSSAGFWNTNTETLDLWDGNSFQKILTVDNAIAGTNMAIDTATIPGKAIFSASGSSPGQTAIQGSFTCLANGAAQTDPTGGPPIPIAMDSALFIPKSQVGTSVSIMTIGGTDTPIIKNTTAGGARLCQVIVNLTIAPVTANGQTYTFFVYTNSGSSQVVGQLYFPSGITAQPISLSAIVSLGFNDYCYFSALSTASLLSPFYAKFFSANLIDTTIASIPDAVVTSGSYADPSWITSLSASKITSLGAGSWTPTFTVNAGISGLITLTRAYYIRVLNLVICPINIFFTANDSSIEFTFDLPITTNFSSTTEVILMGQVLATASPNAADGDVINATSIVGTNTMKINVNATLGSGIKYLRGSIIYEVI